MNLLQIYFIELYNSIYADIAPLVCGLFDFYENYSSIVLSHIMETISCHIL